MHKVFIAASEVKQGDTLCYSDLRHFFIEQVSERDGDVVLHAELNTHRFVFKPHHRVRVLLGSDRAVAGHDTAAIEADLAMTRLKQSGQWDAIRFAAANRADFQEQAARAANGWYWA